MPDAIAISASATSKPAVGKIMRGGDAAVLDQLAHEIAIALLGREIDRRRRALFPAADVAQIERLAEPALRIADQQDRFAFALEGKLADFVKSSSTPTPPIVGVGRIARPLVSL